MNGTEAFNHLCRYIREDMLPPAQLHLLITVVRNELKAPKATNQAQLLADNLVLRDRITTLEMLIEEQQEQLNRLLPVDMPSRRGRKKNDNS